MDFQKICLNHLLPENNLFQVNKIGITYIVEKKKSKEYN